MSCLSVYCFASDFPELHKLTEAALIESKFQEPENLKIDLVLIRKIGQANQIEAIARLTNFPATNLLPKHQLYYEALSCEIRIRAGDMDSASPHCEKTRTMLEMGLSDVVAEAVGHNAMGYYLVRQGKPELALTSFEEALSRVSGSVDDVLRVQYLHNRGVALMLYGLFDLAITAFEAADSEKHVLSVDDQLPRILAYNLGYLQAHRGEHEEALTSYSIVIPWLESTGQAARAYIGHVQVALSLTALGRHRESLDELQPWMERTDVPLTPDSESQAFLALGQAQLGLGLEEEGLDSLLQGIAIARNADNSSRVRELSLAYSSVLVSKGEYALALEYLKDLIVRLEASGIVEGRGQTHRLLATSYAGLGDFSTAYTHSLAAYVEEKAAQSDETIRRLTSLRISNELDVKDQQLALSIEREVAIKANQRLVDQTQWGIITGLLVALVVVYLFLSQRNNRREASIQRETSAALKKEVELRTADVARELEKRHAAEQAKAALEVRLMKDEKLRSIGQLTGGVAHDFNNLMTIILLSAELLTPDMDPERQKLLGDIIGATESGKAITRGLLAYARQQTLRPVVLNLDTYLAVNKTLFQRSLEESLQFSISPAKNSANAAIEVDEGQLTSCILNLIFNAKEASQENGEIVLTVTEHAGRVAIEVRDTGRGMTEREIEMATEPFYSTKTVSEGSGLGLSMVYGFMKQSGGDLVIESEPGEGTRVALVFEAVSITGAALQKVKSESIESESKHVKILLVEDEPRIRDIGKAALEQSGYHVLVAEDGDGALKVMEASSDIDVLISDLIMPGKVSGEKLLSIVKERNPNISILLISGYAENIPGGYRFLAKPFSLTELRQAVVALLSENDAGPDN